jgi:hypothetical protein
MPRIEDICIFTRSYRGDFVMLPYLYRSIEKYASHFGEVILVVEEEDCELVKDFVPDWVRLEKEKKFTNGVIQHKYTKLTANKYTDKKYVCHVDSDTIFISRPEVNGIFYEGRPYLEVARYEDLLRYQDGEEHVSFMKSYVIENLIKGEIKKDLISYGVKNCDDWMLNNYEQWMNQNFEKWFTNWFIRWKDSFGIDIWREGTEFSIGTKVDYEYSRRTEKVYPREVYDLCREHIERVHTTSLESYISTRIGKQTNGTKRSEYFSDLNFIGAILEKYLKHSMEWVDVTIKGYEFRPIFLKQFISYDIVENGRIKDRAVSEYEKFL